MLQIPNAIKEIGFQASYSPKISLTGQSNLTISNLIIQADTAHAISLDNCSNITIEKVILYGYNNLYRGIHINNCQNVLIKEYIALEQGGRIRVQGNSNNITIAAGRHWNCGTSSKEFSGRNSIQILNGTGSIKILFVRTLMDIEKSVSVKCAVDQITFLNYPTQESFVISNFMKGNSKWFDADDGGGGIMTENMTFNTCNLHVINNRIHSCGRYGIRRTSGYGGSVVGNHIYMPKFQSRYDNVNKYGIGLFLNATNPGNGDDFGGNIFIDQNKVFFQLDTNVSGLDNGYENGFGGAYAELSNLRFGNNNNFTDTSLNELNVVPPDFFERFWQFKQTSPIF